MPHVIVGSLFIAIIAMAGWLIVFYNKMINKRIKLDEVWEEIVRQLLMRADLILNLGEKVPNIVAKDQETIIRIIEARSSFAKADSLEEVLKYTRQINKDFCKILDIYDQYPQLRISSDFILLINHIGEAENKIFLNIQQYNDVVKSYKEFLRKFPNNVAISIIGAQNEPSYIKIEAMTKKSNWKKC